MFNRQGQAFEIEGYYCKACASPHNSPENSEASDGETIDHSPSISAKQCPPQEDKEKEGNIEGDLQEETSTEQTLPEE